jgi:hypothetical protein
VFYPIEDLYPEGPNKMKITNRIHRIALALMCCLAGTLKAQDIYVVNYGTNTVGEYRLDGSIVNTSLISGLYEPEGIAVSGNDLFVGNGTTSGYVSEYTTSGAAVNTNLISGLNYPTFITILGDDLFVANAGSGTIGEYTLSGATVNATLITGVRYPIGLAVSGTNLFVVNELNGTIGEYTTSGATVNANLISGLNIAQCIAISPVPSPPPPRLTTINVNGSTLSITATNGPGGGTYTLLESTNLGLSLTQWTPILTNTFTANGSLNLSTNIVNPARPAEFYILEVP